MAFELFKWILVLQGIGFIGLPISCFLFKFVKGKGVGFSKPLGIIILCTSYWLISHIPHFPQDPFLLKVWFFCLISISSIALIAKRSQIVSFIKENKILLISIEVVFMCVFLFWVFVRMYDPNISGTEKPMDFMILNSVITSSNNFPPPDLWFSGEVISYYYFGYWIFGMISKLSNISAPVSYNLSVATVASLSACSILGLISMLIRENKGTIKEALIVGIFAVFLAIFSSNLHVVWEALTLIGVLGEGFLNWLSIDGLNNNLTGEWYLQGGWWRSTRIINFFDNKIGLDYTISEFPSFSLLLGDLHPHLMSIPFLLLSLATVYMFKSTRLEVGNNYKFVNISRLLLITLIFGALGFINGWDLPLMIGILFVFFIIFPFVKSMIMKQNFFEKQIIYLPFIVIGALLIFYSHYFVNLATQIQFPPIMPVMISSRLIHFITIWGMFLIIISPILLKNAVLLINDFSISDKQSVFGERNRRNLFYLIILCVFGILFIFLSFVQGIIYKEINFLQIIDNGKIVLPLFGLVLISTRTILKESKLETFSSEHFINGLLCISLTILLTVELFRLNDLFGNRMNTIFKSYYQVWILMSVISGYVIWSIFFKKENNYINAKILKMFIAISLVLSIIISTYYISSTIHSRSNGFQNKVNLNGVKFLETYSPTDYRIISWVINNTESDDVVLEAVGRDYTQSSLISTFSGRATVLGWPGHEHQWRGDTITIETRKEDVSNIYTSNDIELRKRLIKQYNVKYVVIGNREIENYGKELTSVLIKLGDLVVNEDKIKLIKINEDD